MKPTWSLSAPPVPVIASLTCVAVYSVTSRPLAAPASRAIPAAWAVGTPFSEIARTNTRSTATASGRVSAITSHSAAWSAASRRAVGSSGPVRTTPARTSVGRCEGPSTTATPHRESPGSIPSTLTGPPFRSNTRTPAPQT